LGSEIGGLKVTPQRAYIPLRHHLTCTTNELNKTDLSHKLYNNSKNSDVRRTEDTVATGSKL